MQTEVHTISGYMRNIHTLDMNTYLRVWSLGSPINSWLLNCKTTAFRRKDKKQGFQTSTGKLLSALWSGTQSVLASDVQSWCGWGKHRI